MFYIKRNPKVVIIAAGLALIISIYLSNRNTKILNEYESILEMGDVNIVVYDFYAYRGDTYIDTDKAKIYIPTSINERLNPEYLCDFLKKGDRILKKEESESLVVCREGVSYVFKVGDLYYSQAPEFNRCDE